MSQKMISRLIKIKMCECSKNLSRDNKMYFERAMEIVEQKKHREENLEFIKNNFNQDS